MKDWEHADDNSKKCFDLAISSLRERLEKSKVIIGDCTLYCEDCRFILPTLHGIDATIADPPYGIGLVKKTSDYRASRYFDNGISLKASSVYRDDPEEIKALIREVVPACLSISTRALFFTGPAMILAYPEPASVGSVFTPNGAGRTAWGFQCTHPIFFYGKDPFLQDGKGGHPNSFRDEQPNPEKIDHPCPKPVKWMRWAVTRASRHGETILDPFMGSGTTGVACVKLGRKFIGIERERKYFDIACRRIEEAYKQPDLFVASPYKPPEQARLL
jgi:DNA modification methylase